MNYDSDELDGHYDESQRPVQTGQLDEGFYEERQNETEECGTWRENFVEALSEGDTTVL